MSSLPLYLDYAATTPVDQRVLEAMWPFFREQYGNASSKLHPQGWIATEAVTAAREQVANLIGSIPEEIIFTSGATESLNLAIRGVAATYASKGNHIITCLTEHRAVLDTCEELEKNGIELTKLEVDGNGNIDLDELRNSISPKTILIALMHTNNETGIIHPIVEIGKIAKEKEVLFLCDASQSAGKIHLDVMESGIDLLALSAHKLYGPKGVGALYIRRKNPRVKLTPQITGGGQERGLRSGTLNVPGIVGLGKAAELAKKEMIQDAKRLRILRDRMEQSFKNHLNVTFNGAYAERLPSISNCCFHLQNHASLLAQLSKIVAISNGSACSSALQTPSHVLAAMGLGEKDSRSSIRFSLGRETDEIQLVEKTEVLIRLVQKLQKEESLLPLL
jgi:cysteine desulfurase